MDPLILMFYRILREIRVCDMMWGGRAQQNCGKLFPRGWKEAGCFFPSPLPPQTENESNHDMHLQCQGGLAWLDLFFKC